MEDDDILIQVSNLVLCNYQTIEEEYQFYKPFGVIVY